jgi:hypothetical protein
MRLENTGERASNLLMLLLGRQDQVELLRDRVATLRRTSDRTAVEEMLERFVGAKSWQHLEATRLLAIQELAYQEASTIESLIGSLREVVAKFDGVFEKVVPSDVGMAAFMEWKPSQVYRKTSEVLLGKALFHKAFDDEDDCRRHRLDLLLSREDLPLEDWIDTEDQELLSRVAAVFDRIEEQLRDKDLPPPPDRVADPG